MPSDDSGAEEKAFPCLKVKHMSYMRLMVQRFRRWLDQEGTGWLRQDSGSARLLMCRDRRKKMKNGRMEGWKNIEVYILLKYSIQSSMLM